NQHDLLVGVGVQVRRIGVVFCLELGGKVFHDITGFGWIKLHNSDIAERGFPGFLFEAERQPDRANLNGSATAAFGDAGLGQRLSNLEALAFKRVCRDHIYFAETRDPRCDRRKVVNVTAKADFRQNLSAEFGKRVLEHLCVADSGVVFSNNSTAVRAFSRLYAFSARLTPCMTSFGIMRKVHGLPGSVTFIEDEPALSSGTLACSMTGMTASVASEHSSPMMTSGLNCSISRLAACVAG